MYTFIIALIVLILGYIFYGSFIARLVDINPQNPTPAMTKADGIDFVPMPTWKVFMIQFLNIAGLGPIFGAIMGAQFGTASYLWIVFGTIFGGAVHDFISVIMSLRNDGESLPQTIGRYLGENVKKVMIVFVLLFLTLAGAVFVSQPANIIVGSLNAPETAIGSSSVPFYMNVYFWVAIIFCYYLIATLFPIDKIIGKIYPIFAIALFFMAIAILIALFVKWPALPEMWESFGTKYDPSPIFPMMFVSIACGAVSGSHATQSPLMARCLKNEKDAKLVFYGAMVAEGIVALIWAAAATAFFQENGTDFTQGQVVNFICHNWLGVFGGILALLGVVFAPITTGDTVLRAARLIVADTFHIEQKSVKNRLLICIPIFAICAGFLVFSMGDAKNFGIVWRYFTWSNQVMAAFTFWAITVYLTQKRKNYFVSIIPAIFMSFVTISFILEAPMGAYIPGKGLTPWIAQTIAAVATIAITTCFYLWRNGKIEGAVKIGQE